MVVRCKRCRTYVNPFVTWQSQGRRWGCNVCGYVNETPQFYYRPTDASGRREDLAERPELSLGSVEYIAPAEYMIRPPQPPSYLFAIDVSLAAVTSGLVDTVCSALREVIQAGTLPGGNRTTMAILTFDECIHFYHLSSCLAQPQMLVVSELDDIFLPLPQGVMVNATDSREQLLALLRALPDIWRNTKCNLSCMGSAIHAGTLAQKSIGGKFFLFSASVPSVGHGQLGGGRDGRKATGGGGANEWEVQLLKPSKDDYKEMAQSLATSQICVDLFLAPMHAVDLATMAPVSQLTAGEVRLYPHFTQQAQGEKLRQELIHVLTRVTGWEAVMRFRVSRGWRIPKWFGHFFFRGTDLLVLPSCHADETFGLLVELEDNVAQEPAFHIQSALLYTNSDGERRIRVHTYCIPISTNFQELAASIDPQVVASLLFHQAIELSLKSTLHDGRTFLQSMCGQISSLAGGETSRVLPLYILGLLKSIALRDAKDITADVRIAEWLRLATAGVDQLCAYFYPRLLSLHDLAPSSAGGGRDGAEEEEALPPALNLTSERLTQGGAYLIEDGTNMLLWIGKAINPDWLAQVFGVHTLEHVHPDMAEAAIDPARSPLALRVSQVLNNLRKERRPDFLRLVVVRQGDPMERRFFSMLIEDRTQSMMISLNEFLAKIAPRMVQQAAAPMGMSQRPF
eukprot:GHVT01002773.1.p1 GENE.GHVT01002773.1~~GHVT01002773.1.p1  ORF type:complete len:682 (+),score=174.81 GHVT01002773.1:2-2047(+)